MTVPHKCQRAVQVEQRLRRTCVSRGRRVIIVGEGEVPSDSETLCNGRPMAGDVVALVREDDAANASAIEVSMEHDRRAREKADRLTLYLGCGRGGARGRRRS